MNKIRTLRFVAMMVASLLGVAKMSAQPFGLWNFDSGNLAATFGTDLTYTEGPGGATQLATVFGTTTSFGIADINGSPAALMNFPAATNGMGYSMATPAANVTANAVNQYTYILDVFYPAASSAKIRPLIRTYASGGTEQYIIVDANGAVGPAVVGAGGITAAAVGALQPNTWYRLGLVVNAGVSVRVYTNGVEMGSFTGGAVDGFFATDPSSTVLILGSTSTNAALGYVNSIQLRNSALNAGQMAALGAASAAGIPATIPPVPSFVDSRTPGVGEANVSEEPAIKVVLNQGDTTVSIGTIQLKLDGVAVGTTANTAVGEFTTTYTVPPRLDPQSAHTLNLTWTDSVAGSRSSTWGFTVKDYQVVTLPEPFYIEDFDSLTEDPVPGVALPAGWTVQNQTAAQTPGFSLTDRQSDTYKDWILISSNRMYGWDAARTNLPTIILNGTKLTSLTSGNLMWAESDSRCDGCTGQFADLYTKSISCVGRTNVFVAWNSIYEQNNDNMNFIEYSIDGGANWLPVIYMFQWPPDDQQPVPQIIYTNSVIDVGATFSQIAPSRNWSPDTPNHSTNYGSYIKAPISTAMIPFIKGYGNDDSFGGKRIEVVRLAAADGQASVKFRINANGTSSWFWGIDNFGLYEISTPVFTTQPSPSTIAAGTVGTFTVVVASPTAVSYQWQHAGTNISNGGHYSGVDTATLTISNADPNDAGAYKCKATNASGPATSNPANLTVVAVPIITTQPGSMVVSDGYPAGFNGLGFGGLPLTYQWRFNGSPVGGNSTSYSLPSAHTANAGNYTLVVNNSYGAVTSQVARLSVVNVPVTSDLVVHLKFDTDYADSSGHGNNSTQVGSPALVPGKLGNAMQFTTSSGLVPAVTNFATLGYPPDLQFGSTTDFSIACWVQYTNQSDDLPIISNSQWDSGSNPGWGIFSQGNGSFRVKVSDVNRVTANTGGVGPIIKSNGWHHILVTFQQGGAMYTMYDGVPVRTNAWTPTASVDTSGANYTRTINLPPNTDFSGPHAVNIGQDGTGWYNDKNGGAITNGLIDDVGFWRRAVSPQEALAIYNGGNAGQDLSQVASPSSLGNLSITYSGGNVNCTWVGGTGILLQKTTVLTNPLSWADIASTLGLSSYSEATTATPTYYRLYKP